ncbi:MAG: haloacetate dehalogenase [Kribbellaceae bacterium]|nr:haloacetate dehalogenase [Kribbellaceae bacterium]
MCPDLRGYGESGKPSSSDDHTPYSKRSMAADVIALMLALGHERFAVVGHDRGSYVAYRTALDHPGAVDRLVVMDGVPVIEALERCDARFASLWWHWFFLGQTGETGRADHLRGSRDLVRSVDQRATGSTPPTTTPNKRPVN